MVGCVRICYTLFVGSESPRTLLYVSVSVSVSDSVECEVSVCDAIPIWEKRINDDVVNGSQRTRENKWDLLVRYSNHSWVQRGRGRLYVENEGYIENNVISKRSNVTQEINICFSAFYSDEQISYVDAEFSIGEPVISIGC